MCVCVCVVFVSVCLSVCLCVCLFVYFSVSVIACLIVYLSDLFVSHLLCLPSYQPASSPSQSLHNQSPLININKNCKLIVALLFDRLWRRHSHSQSRHCCRSKHISNNKMYLSTQSHQQPTYNSNNQLIYTFIALKNWKGSFTCTASNSISSNRNTIDLTV